MSDEMKQFYQEIRQDFARRSDASGLFQEDAFFEVFTEHLVSAGQYETADRAFYAALLGLRVDGYGGDPLQSDNVLTIFVSEIEKGEETSTMTATSMGKVFKRATNFIEKALDPEFREALEESSPAYGLADLISKRWNKLAKVQLVILTNQVLSSRVDTIPSGVIRSVPVTHSVWDLGRLYRMVVEGRGHEDIVIDLEKEFGPPIPALPAHLDEEDYQSYLLVVPGDQLAKIYDKWRTRLLEQNVRVFLQARANVNKGIRNTLAKDPGMFFAYNNGVTATAKSVSIQEVDGGLVLTNMSDFQIVNGGQTTASIHAAMGQKTDLSRVFVQMKLSIIEPERSDEIVPRISQFANSQNRVNAADFFSNHPFHVRMETFSRRVYAPAADGSLRQSKWFYERARGQYQDGRSRLTTAKRKEFDAEYPRKQLFSKTDLAKFLRVWDGLPDAVSKGAQKNFGEFAPAVAKQWEKNDKVFSEVYYKTAISKAIVFKAMEVLVQNQEWYGGGYRANVVAYGIAKLAHDLGKRDGVVDFEKIWREQGIGEPLEECLTVSAKAAHDVLTSPPKIGQNVTEWAKQQACWHRLQETRVSWPRSLEQIAVGYEQQEEAERDGRKDQKMVSGIEAQMAVVRAGGAFWSDARFWGNSHSLLTARESSILADCREIPKKLPSESQCLVALRVLARLQGEGLDVELVS